MDFRIFKLSKLKVIFNNNLPLVLSITILFLSLFYTFGNLSTTTNELKLSSTNALNDFSTEVNISISNQIELVSSLMMDQWLSINGNVSLLTSYSRFLDIVPNFFNYSTSYLAINWINSSGIINWVYPYDRNAAAINHDVHYRSDTGELNEGFYLASHERRIALTPIKVLAQGGLGFASYIPIIYSNNITGYFNVVFEIIPIMHKILNHQVSLDNFGFIIFENSSLVTGLNENFSLNDSFVFSKNITFYNKVWVIYSRPSAELIFRTSPLSVANIFLAEILLCIAIYYLTNRLKKKNEIIQNEYNEKEKIMDAVYRGKKFQALGTISGGIAHDFNNIMANIKGHIEIIKSSVSDLKIVNDPLNNEPLTIIDSSIFALEKNLNRSKDITGQILTFSRQGSKTYEVTDLEEVIKESIKLVSETADKRINFLVSSKNKKYFILANYTQLLQVIMNILINSVNAVDSFIDAKIEVTCYIDEESYNGQLLAIAKQLKQDQELHFHTHGVILKIKDNGKGMNKDQISNAFDPFYSPITTGKGTGLGLSIVYNNITSIGGEVSIQSELDKYTEITIKLPLIDSDETEIGTLIEKKEFVASKVDKIGQSTNILLIDDEEDITKVYGKILENKGFSTKGFLEGKSGLDYFEKNCSQIETVIVDMNLPDINGFDVIKQIRSIKPNQKIIVISGYFEEHINIPNIPILQKPFEIDQLINILIESIE